MLLANCSHRGYSCINPSLRPGTSLSTVGPGLAMFNRALFTPQAGMCVDQNLSLLHLGSLSGGTEPGGSIADLSRDSAV